MSVYFIGIGDTDLIYPSHKITFYKAQTSFLSRDEFYHNSGTKMTDLVLLYFESTLCRYGVSFPCVNFAIIICLVKQLIFFDIYIETSPYICEDILSSEKKSIVHL